MTEVIETVWITLSDGARLAARLWLPDGARENPVPAILEYIPYRRRDRTRLRDESMHPRFAEAGYAAIRVDMRGTGDSDGVMLDEYTHQEINDGAELVGWIAEQDWCSGSVGMFGKSWGAYTSFQVAALRPPALKAIAPVMGTDDRWLEDVHYYGGVLNNDNFWWGSVMQLLNAMPPDPQIAGRERWRVMWKQRLEAMTFWPAQWLAHQTRDAMWRRGSVSENYDDINIPVYFFGGWADLFRDTPFRIAENLKCPVKILMGPWAHLYPHEGIPEPKVDFPAELIRFWDHWLKGIDTGLMDEPRCRFWLSGSEPPSASRRISRGEWAEEDSWPSPNVSCAQYWLNSGRLGGTPEEGAEMTVRSPQHFGSSGGDMCSFAIPGDMPTDCRLDAGGALSFRGDTLTEPLSILGQPSLRLKLTADRELAFAAALLIDESPTGEQTLISRGFCNLTHRNSDTDPDPVVPGEEMDVTLQFHGIGYRMAAGHRLVLQLASAYWPILWPSPEPVTLGLRCGQSRLDLPVRQSNGGEPRELPAPRPWQRNAEQIGEGELDRSWKIDLATGEHLSRFYVVGGVFGPSGRTRLTETGTELGDTAERIYRILPDDPLSARASMEQESRFTRSDWSVRIKTKSSMRAGRDEFILEASVECWDGEELFHTVEWEHTIPRRCT